MAAAFQLCAMPDTNSSLNGLFGASLFGASLVAAAFHLCAMPDTNSSLLGFVVASLVAAAFHLCAMPDTNSSPLYFKGEGIGCSYSTNMSNGEAQGKQNKHLW